MTYLVYRLLPTHLFTVLQLDKHTIIVLGGNALWKATCCLYKHFQRTYKKLKKFKDDFSYQFGKLLT